MGRREVRRWEGERAGGGKERSEEGGGRGVRRGRKRGEEVGRREVRT